MGNNKNLKFTVWIYAVILFTSAFIVLLITAYSQIKYNKNIDNYKNQLSQEESAKYRVQSNLKSALEENSKLQSELNSLKESFTQAQNELNKLKEDMNDLNNEIEIINITYEKLLLAENEFSKGNIINCALILSDDFYTDYLQGYANERYNYLHTKTFVSASESLYFKGLDYFKKGDYTNAEENFKSSLKILKDQYFSDDGHYLLCYSLFYQNKKDEARNFLIEFFNLYPDSIYKNEAEILLSKL